MAKERRYGWNGENPAKDLSGQAKIVFDVLKGAADELHTGREWTEIVGTELRTRQDPYRVVLYYILILKNRGLIRTSEFDINAVTKSPELVKHGITVKTAAHVEERHIIEIPEEIADVPFEAAEIEEVYPEVE